MEEEQLRLTACRAVAGGWHGLAGQATGHNFIHRPLNALRARASWLRNTRHRTRFVPSELSIHRSASAFFAAYSVHASCCCWIPTTPVPYT